MTTSTPGGRLPVTWTVTRTLVPNGTFPRGATCTRTGKPRLADWAWDWCPGLGKGPEGGSRPAGGRRLAQGVARRGLARWRRQTDRAEHHAESK